MKVTIELNENQAYVLMNALEFFSRIKMGQFLEIHQLFLREDYDRIKNTDRTLIENIETVLKRAIFPELDWNSYHGIHSKNISESAKIAWDVYQVLRHDISWVRNPEGGMTVNYDEPFQVSKETLPTVNICQ